VVMNIAVGFVLPVDSPPATINRAVGIDPQVRGPALPGMIAAHPAILLEMEGIEIF